MVSPSVPIGSGVVSGDLRSLRACWRGTLRRGVGGILKPSVLGRSSWATAPVRGPRGKLASDRGGASWAGHARSAGWCFVRRRLVLCAPPGLAGVPTALRHCDSGKGERSGGPLQKSWPDNGLPATGARHREENAVCWFSEFFKLAARIMPCYELTGLEFFVQGLNASPCGSTWKEECCGVDLCAIRAFFLKCQLGTVMVVGFTCDRFLRN